MKKFVIYLSLFLSLFSIASPAFAVSTDITDVYDIKITPIPYDKQNPDQSCPPQMDSIYAQLNETCATSYDDFLTDPIKKHYWIEDPAITAQGKSDERARQFLYWVLTTSAIDDAPVLRQIWNTVSLVAIFGVILIAAIFGIGYIISTRTNFDFKIRIWPTIIKLGVMLLYVVLSAAIVLLLIQLSEVIMKFFIDTLGGKDLFNIYFTTPTASSQTTLLGATERSYKEFIGARDLNIRVQEGIQAEMYLLKMTNVTYYVMGVMLLLRKILLWFLLFVSPFLALLMPFVLIRNTGWIWIGVFFQWLFYGPLLALFLGATSKIWKEGIPFNFDFSRTTPPTAGFRPEGYVYPTGMNIVYGGPGQNGGFGRAINSGNNGNYIDTFAEYVITLIMLWAVTFFPWWLLRIFRDYCCEGIYAMRNILLAMYDQMRSVPPPKGPVPGIPPKGPTTTITQNTPTNTNISVSLGSIEAIRRTVSSDIARNLNLRVQRLTDVAQLETNRQTRNTVIQNITYISNPVKIQKPVERQQYMNLRSELFARAIKNDSIAKTILASTSTTTAEQIKIRQELVRTIPTQISISQVVVNSIKMPKEKVYTITNNYTKSIVNNEKTINNIAKSANTTNQAVKNVLNSYAQHTTESPTQVVQSIAKETNLSPQTIKTVLAQNGALGRYISEVHKTVVSENISKEKVTNLINSLKEMTVTTSPSTPPGGPSLVAHISNQTNVPVGSVEKILSQSYTSVNSHDELVQQIAGEVKVEPPQVKAVITAYVEGIGNSPQTTINTIAKEQHLDNKTVTNILQQTSHIASTISNEQLAEELHVEPQQLPKIMEIASDQFSRPEVFKATAPEIRVMETTSLPERVAKDTDLSQKTIAEVVNKTVTTVLSNETSIQEIATKVNTAPETIKNVIQSYSTHINEVPQSTIRTIAQEQHLSTSQVTQILTETMQMATHNETTTAIAQETSISQDQITSVVHSVSEEINKTNSEIKDYPSILEQITKETKLPSEAIQKIVIQSYDSVTNDQESVAQIAEKVHTSPEQVKQSIQAYSSNIRNDSQTVLQTISKDQNLSTTVISQIMNEATTIAANQTPPPTLVEELKIQAPQVQQIIKIAGQEAKPAAVTVQTPSTEPVIKVISYKSNLTEDASKHLISNIMNQAVKNDAIINQVQQETQLQPQQIKNVINTFAQNVTEPAPVIIDRISETSGIPKDKVQSVVNTTADTILSAQKVVTDVAEKEGVKEEDVTNTILTQMDLAAKPNENIEKVIPIPQSVSIEDYEQVKEMWTKHYEEGEIPVSETIQSRSDWIEQEIVYITNTLNKILSNDDALRQEGLDELGFLLPIFLINNLKGEELVVYLKAKLEAAKQTQKIMAREEAVKSKYEKKKEEENEEELVEVNKPKEEEAPQEMTMSFDEDEEETPQSIEDRENAVREKLENMESPDESIEPSIDDIKSKLQAQGETEKTDLT